MKKFFTSPYLIGAIALVVAIAGIWWLRGSDIRAEGEHDAFAQCLGEQGAVFYGAFWCPHCQAQKKLFGRSDDLLPYVECSTPDGEGQTEECTAAGIESYPTWEFEDGSRETGEVPLETLAEKTGCELPNQE